MELQIFRCLHVVQQLGFFPLPLPDDVPPICLERFIIFAALWPKARSGRRPEFRLPLAASYLVRPVGRLTRG